MASTNAIVDGINVTLQAQLISRQWILN